MNHELYSSKLRMFLALALIALISTGCVTYTEKISDPVRQQDTRDTRESELSAWSSYKS
jgi:hypothetical protein